MHHHIYSSVVHSHTLLSAPMQCSYNHLSMPAHLFKWIPLLKPITNIYHFQLFVDLYNQLLNSTWLPLAFQLSASEIRLEFASENSFSPWPAPVNRPRGWLHIPYTVTMATLAKFKIRDSLRIHYGNFVHDGVWRRKAYETIYQNWL